MASTQSVDGSSWSSALFIPRVLCVALAASCGIYAFLLFSGIILAGTPSELTYVIPMVGLAYLPVAYIIPRFLGKPAIESETREDASGLFGDATERVLSDPKDARKKFVEAEMSPFIVRVAICEAVAIMGLVSHMVAATPLPVAVGLCGISALATLANFPRRADWQARAEKRFGARFESQPV